MITDHDYCADEIDVNADVEPVGLLKTTSDAQCISAYQSGIHASIDDTINNIMRLCHKNKFIHSVNTLRKLRANIDYFLNDFESIVENDAREKSELPKQHALRCIVDNRYPEEIRHRMLQSYDREDYDSVLNLAACYDMPLRERPNAGKTGPDDPIKIYNEKLLKDIAPESLEFGGQTREK